MLCCIHADLTDLQALPNVFGSAIRQLGQADILVNSAALTGGTLDLLSVSADEMARAYTLNTTVPLLLMHHFAFHVMARGVNGRIVNLSSSSAFRAADAGGIWRLEGGAWRADPDRGGATGAT